MTQDEIVNSIGEEQRRYRKEWKLEGGSYRSRHIAIAGKRGHVASFDWLTGKMHCELELRETCRDITFLNDHSHFAVAQKQHVYIYDQQGIELHRLREHIDITRLEYLPYHWLLVSVGNPGVLRYHDTSIGHIVATHKTKLGSCQAMTQNPHNAVIYLGHQNGTVSLWTPNLDEPAVKLLAHLGGVTSLSVDPSTAGRYMATSGMDGKVKVWDCRNWKGCVREWDQRGTGHAEVDWSQKGFLGVASGGTVNVYTPPSIITEHHGSPPLYLTHPIPQRPLTSARFCPYTDMLTIGHANGLSSIIVPGAGEPTFDSSELDPFESKKMRREREVHNLLDKIQPDLITLDPDFVGTIAEPDAQDEFEDSQYIPTHRLPRWEKLKRAGMEDPGMAANSASGSKKVLKGVKEDDDMEVGYSASDTSESEYEVDEAGHDDSGAPTVRRKKKKSALKAYLNKSGGNVVDPTVTLFNFSDLPQSVTVDICSNDEDCDWEEALAELFVNQEWESDDDDDDDEEDKSPPPIPIGFAPLFEAVDSDSPSSPPKYYLCYLAFATASRVVVIPTPNSQSEPCGYDKWSAISNFTTGNAHTGVGRDYVLVGFEMPSAVLACFREANLRVVGVDLSVVIDGGIAMLPSVIVEGVIGEPNGRQFEKIWRRLSSLPADANDDAYCEHVLAQENCVAWRAWMCAITGRARLPAIQKAHTVDSEPRNDFTQKDLALLADLQHQYDLLEASNPQVVVTEYSTIAKMNARDIVIKQTAFKNKARAGQAQNIVIRKGDTVVAEGKVVETEGKETLIMLKGDAEVDDEHVDQIEVHGRSDLTRAEVARNAYMLRFLQGDDALSASPFIRKIWFPDEEDLDDLRSVKINVEKWKGGLDNDPLGETELNPSQANVARAMLSENSFALVHGPPGTGKTRTIAEVVKVWDRTGKKAYLVAQTNVGVKNIAEKLISSGIENFRLLVSNEFYQEWHEAEYNKCEGYMLRSSQFKKELRQQMGNITFVLCTISMLFSPVFEKIGLFRMIPMERLVVDEASQIFVGDYLALFYKFRETLAKVCWFGDPRQLPPHQREQIQGLKSIYDIPHVKDASLMLDTQ
ncbi:Small subunit (SSU) processome component, partial [Tulasnella sp. 427]